VSIIFIVIAIAIAIVIIKQCERLLFFLPFCPDLQLTYIATFLLLPMTVHISSTANVPQQFPENHSLGIWVNKMRMERKKWDTGSERTSLTERKIELLESIDFIWAQNHKGEIGWERRFQEIRKFKRKHGHCNVPTKSAENRALGRWVSTQRTMYKNYMKGFVGKSLTREEQERRIFLLLKEGFLFSMIPNGQNPGGAGSGDDSNEDGIVTMTIDPACNNMHTVDSAMDLAAPTTGATNGTATTDTSTSTPTISTTTSMDAAAVDITGAEHTTTSADTKSSPLTPTTKTNTNDDDDNKDNNDHVSDSKDSDDRPDEKKDEQIGDSDDQKVVTSPSPSSQLTEIITEAAPSSPSAREVSVTQVSLTTTPPTTPSVSTTASTEKLIIVRGTVDDICVNDDGDIAMIGCDENANEGAKLKDVVGHNNN